MSIAPLSLSYAIAACAYGVLAVLVLKGLRGSFLGWAFLLTVLATVLWAFTGLLLTGSELGSEPLLDLITALRNTAWLGLTYLLWRHVAAGEAPLRAVAQPIARVGAGLGLTLLGLVTLAAAQPGNGLAAQLGQIALLGFAVVGLVLVDSFRTSCKGSELWAVKHLLIGLGGLFAYDLFVASEALLLRQIGEATRLAQPLVAAMIAPLLGVAASRIGNLRINIPVSRQLVLQTSALLLCGFYLLAVAAAGFLLRALGLQWGAALQLVFGFAAGLVLVVVVGSGELRARGRRFVGRHFFEFAYDYRQEWLRFVETMAGGKDRLSLHERAIQAIADPIECTGGFLYLRERGDHWRLTASWNWSPPAGLPPPPGELIEQLALAPAVLDPMFAARPEGPVSDWLQRFGDVWFAHAIAAQGRMVGFVILGKPRAGRLLTGEDRDLLKVLSVQIAGYLTEEQTITALAEARRFERMSKNFSFIAHDLKNIVSQLSLILQQAKRRGDNPAFVRDALDTVEYSVEKMRAMLLRLRDRAESSGVEALDLDALLADIVSRKRIVVDNLVLEREEDDFHVLANRSAVAAILENLIDNARDAGGPQVDIRLRVSRDAHTVFVDVVDDGPGMTFEFVQDHLFQPFSSTKSDGFGIGMYQCREWLESWGGGLEVESEVGEGTTVRLRFPSAVVRPASTAPVTRES
jgi:putative PEP-CTERM system histidine kinase